MHVPPGQRVFGDHPINLMRQLTSLSVYPTDHEASGDCGVTLLGPDTSKFWYNQKCAKPSANRTRHAIGAADIVVLRFSENSKQYNAALDAGPATTLGKSLIGMRRARHEHALKEINTAAAAMVTNAEKVTQTLRYTLTMAMQR